MNNFLQVIQQSTLERIHHATVPIEQLREKVASARKPHSFLDIFKNEIAAPACIIAEIKFASPSLGTLTSHINPKQIAEEYLTNGASALSILTEPNYFKGSLTYLEEVRHAFPHAHLLMKDFILDEYQLLQARIHGADAVLLIAAFLNDLQLEHLYFKAIELGLTPLMEVHSEEDLRRIQKLRCQLIGVNNRNLATLKVDLKTSQLLRQYIPSNAMVISESGIQSGADIKILQQHHYQGFLIGGHFMQNSSPGVALKNMLSEVTYAS